MILRRLRGWLAAILLLVAATGACAGGVSPVPLGSAPLDQAFGTTVGGMLCRTSSGWAVLAAGSAAQVLTVPSGGGCPAWATPASGGNVSNTGTPTAGQIALFTNATTVQGVNLLPVAAGGTGVATAAVNTVFAGPSSGSAAAPTFRALVPADNPAAADGCVRLSVASTTSLKLSPYGCNTLSVGGATQTVPSAGVTLSSPSVSPSTLYYVYAAGASNVVSAISLSTTGHVTGSDGREYLSASGSANTVYRLVGMVYTNASGQFSDSVTFRGCLNWFNRRALPILQSASNQGTASTSATGITGGVYFLSWADDDASVDVTGFATASSSVVASSVVFIDGASSGQYVNQALSAGGYGNVGTGTRAFLTEGAHTTQAAGNSSSSSVTVNFYVTLSGTIRG